MRYTIPNNKLSKLQKIISKYQKKGANITFKLGDEVIEDGILTVNDNINHCTKNFPIKVTCREVFVDGSYIINGWQFVGTIEFTDLGNIIRLADSSFENKVPVKYLHTSRICEHCGKIRNRKDTYLIYNKETNEFKQVGSSCLFDYTQGLDAEKCADMMSCLNRFIELSNKDFSEEDFMGNDFGYGLSRDVVLPIAYAYVKQYGYQRMSEGKGTAHDILIMLCKSFNDEEMTKRYDSLVMPTDEELKVIDEIAKSTIDKATKDLQEGKYDINQYMYNASLAWLNNSLEYRDFSLVASFINTCLKQLVREAEKAKQIAERNNEWVDNIGDKITINVASARVLYTKDNSCYSYYANCTFVMEIIDTEGHTYKWSASTNDIKEGDIIVATVKDKSEYQGIKQTVITRGKVTNR